MEQLVLVLSFTMVLAFLSGARANLEAKRNNDESRGAVNTVSLEKLPEQPSEITFSSILQTIHGMEGSVRFVFGFSTGHVGSTSFAMPAAYNQDDLVQENVKFLFEQAYVEKGVYAQSTWDFKAELHHVEHIYGPELLKGLNYSQHSVCVDLSHSNLYFYRGLLAALHQNKVKFTFIRITRERHETIRSMQIEKQYNVVNFFVRDFFRYHPFEAMDRLVHPMPGSNEADAHSLWDNFTGNQRVMWAIDETQARWEQLLACHPLLPHIHVHWSKAENNIDAALHAIAEVIGVRVSSSGKVPQVKVHAGSKSENFAAFAESMSEEGLYQYHLWPVHMRARELAISKKNC